MHLCRYIRRHVNVRGNGENIIHRLSLPPSSSLVVGLSVCTSSKQAPGNRFFDLT